MPAPRSAKSSPAPSTRTRVVGYVRVSTDKQADAGVSLAAQRAKIEAYAALYDLDLVAVIEDAGVSAKTLDRPGLRAALDMLDAGRAEALVIAKLDRLTRSVRDLGALIDSHFGPGGSALLSVGDQIDTRSAAGRLVLNVLMSVAQWEREAIGERTSAAMAHKAAVGEYTGGRVPFGFALDADGKTLVHNEAEAAALALARELRASGLSIRTVAARLEAAGYRNRNGKPYAFQAVGAMLAEAA